MGQARAIGNQMCRSFGRACPINHQICRGVSQAEAITGKGCGAVRGTAFRKIIADHDPRGPRKFIKMLAVARDERETQF